MAIDALGSTVDKGVKGRQLEALLSKVGARKFAAARASLSIQQEQLLLWVPIFLIVGNWSYFQLRDEPTLLLTAAIALIAIALLFMRQKSILFFLIGISLIGFCATKLREEMVATPMLRGPTSGVKASGYLADFSTTKNGARMLVVAIDNSVGIPDGEHPKSIRIFSDKSGDLQIGDYISFEAYLAPLPRPVEPGGFDYARMQYFASIGAGGRMIGAPLREVRPVPWAYEYRRLFRRLRASISTRITAVIPGAVGHLADSMVSGERSGIPGDMNTSLQISGLAHIISISGLHMSLVAGGVFWAVRALLALVPYFALRWPIKKIAAVVALAVGLIYTLLADSGSATQRSYLMIAVMFFAVLVDRPAISLRNLAIAAIIILLVTPEESVGASFQMSFLAVMGLASFSTWWNAREKPKEQEQKGIALNWLGKLKRVLIVSSLTTLVAGGTSTIAAVYHFDRLSPYSVIANGLSLPVSEALVMPPALIAVLLMPFGLEYYPLKVMEFGLWATMKVSDWTASLPAANLLVAKPNVVGIVMIALAAGIIAVGVGGLRWVGLGLAALGLVVATFNARPDVLVEDRAATVAVQDASGNYVFSTGSKNKFASGKWLQGNGETTGLIDAEARPGWDCSAGDCFTDLGAMSIAYLHEKSGQGVYCPPTQIIIADYPLHFACREAKVVIDRFDVWRKGAHAITFNNGRYIVTTARDEQGTRPWAYDSRKSIGAKPRAPSAISPSSTAPAQ